MKLLSEFPVWQVGLIWNHLTLIRSDLSHQPTKTASPSVTYSSLALLQSHLILSLRFTCTQPRHSVCLDVTHVQKLSYLIIIIRCCQLTAGYKDSFTNGGGTQHYATMHADISNQFRTHFSISLPECQWLTDLIRI